MKNSIVLTSVVAMLVLFISTVNGQNDLKNAELKIKTSSVCDMCKETIESNLAYEKGIKRSDLDVKTSILTVVYNPKKTTPEKIRKAVSKIGYDADDVLADPNAYEKLNSCCKKDKGKH